MATQRTKRSKAKKITLSEFKTWLAGVQSMQPADWHPSKENWDMILDQIANITETVVEKEVIVKQPIAPAHQQPASQVPNAELDPNNPANVGIVERPAPRTPPRMAPSAIPLAGERPPATVKMGKPTGEHGGVAVDIPNGDDGYESSFS